MRVRPPLLDQDSAMTNRGKPFGIGAAIGLITRLGDLSQMTAETPE